MIRRKRRNNQGAVVVVLGLTLLLVLVAAIYWAARNTKHGATQTTHIKEDKALPKQKHDAPMPPADAPNLPAEPTSEQRSAWNRARAKWDTESFYVYALTGVNNPKRNAVDGRNVPTASGWKVRCTCLQYTLIGEAFSNGWVFIQGGSFRGRSIDGETAAREIAKEPSTQVAVVVDLFSKNDPVALAWYRTEGGDVRELKNGPLPNIKESFAKHMRYVQQKIGD